MNHENKAKWGILGTANIAKKALVPGIKDADNSELFAVASRSEGKARQFAEEFELPSYYSSYENLLGDTEIDFVYIPLPNHLHHEWTINAFKKGKNVLCEKPLGTNSGEVEEMFEIAGKENLTLMEGFMYRFHPQTRKVKELIEKGEIGEPSFFRGAFSFPLITEDRDDDIRWKEEMGGGSLMDLGTYSVNTVRYLFGEEPNRVFGRNFTHPDHTAEAETQAILEFPSGKTATIDSSFLLTDRANYEVTSKNGRIQAFDTYGPRRGKRLKIDIDKGNTRETEVLEGVNEYSLEVEHLVDSVREEKTPFVSPEDSINNAKVLDGIRASAEEEKWVQV
ncbi:Gfo/Idh/MocA family oxidoreductase [Candidatus Bipolaricaulota bacterium]|nr:Gfo/Idh/MocA family oxidoreductase [Candidatus Bipolaricaulota bacterium]